MSTINCIAERKLIAVSKGTGQRKEITVKVGVPYFAPNDDFASCPIECEGLFNELIEAKGIDMMQALYLAADTDQLLRAFEHKYDFFWPNGEPYFDEP